MNKSLLLATRNADKIKEIQYILKEYDYQYLSLLDFPEVSNIVESGLTLEENAFIKARKAFEWTGMSCIADDTGLEVDCLNGDPGVRSSRFAGESATYHDNNKKLLQLMNGIPKERRTARFRCVVAFVSQQIEHSVEGVCRGRVLDEYLGYNGFGYDPLFYVEEYQKTFAEMDLETKNQISHRGIAFRKMAGFIDSQKLIS